jgi:CBS domain-containing protein
MTESSCFERPVHDVMRAPVHTLAEDDRLSLALERLTMHRVAAMPVLDGTLRLAGVLSRTDLLRAGRIRVTTGIREHVVTIPDGFVREHMTPEVHVVDPTHTLRRCARRMVDRHVHRLFVARDRHPVGVVGTREMTRVVADSDNTLPLDRLMSTSVLSIDADEPLSLAVDRLAATHVHGLLVMEKGWPTGLFTQEDALGARHAQPSRPVSEHMDYAFVCAPAKLAAARVATRMLVTGVRHALAVDEREVVGVVTGMDFARVVAGVVDDARTGPR